MGLSLLELFLIAVGLSMDAFAVSICKGLSTKKLTARHYLIIGLWFGGFQAIMPAIGYLLGSTFERYITAVDHWVAFVLLSLIGAGMIREALSKEEDKVNDSFAPLTMLLLALATSIDALAVGITFACVPLRLIAASALLNTLLGVSVIGVTTFVISCAGVKIGNLFGTRWKAKAEIAGGVILLLIGLKILLEHFGIL